MPPDRDYSTVTEIAGELVSREAIAMMQERYWLSAQFATGKAVLEVSCGAGFGLGCIAKTAERVVGLDITRKSLAIAQATYGDRVDLIEGDAALLPFGDSTFDLVAIHEAIYYFRQPHSAFSEACRVLRPNGHLVVSTVNPEWADFNPSPFSTSYLTAQGLFKVLGQYFSRVDLYGGFPVDCQGWRPRLISVLKRSAVSMHLIPKTMKGKRLLKRLFYGQLNPVPRELRLVEPVAPPRLLDPAGPDVVNYKVIYAIACREEPKSSLR